MSTDSSPHYIETDYGAKLAYYKTEGQGPGVVFFGGLMSDMTGSKALALEALCKEQGRAFLRFDYTGHGASSGEFADGSIGDWSRDAIYALDHLTQGPQLVIGSSMGGWQMLLAALARPERVAGLIGIAAAPDFSVRLMWEKMTDAQRAELVEQGVLHIPNDYGDEPYTIRHHFIEESRQHMLLDKEIPIDCPVHLLHGMDDADVPWELSVKTAEQLRRADVQISLVKGVGHRFSEPEQLALLRKTVNDMLEKMAQG